MNYDNELYHHCQSQVGPRRPRGSEMKEEEDDAWRRRVVSVTGRLRRLPESGGSFERWQWGNVSPIILTLTQSVRPCRD